MKNKLSKEIKKALSEYTLNEKKQIIIEYANIQIFDSNDIKVISDFTTLIRNIESFSTENINNIFEAIYIKTIENFFN